MTETVTTKYRITNFLSGLGEYLNIRSKKNAPNFLLEIFMWQEASREAEKQLKDAWKSAQESGVIPDDDTLRENESGEHIVAEAGQFSCVATLTEPRETFNRDMFIEKLGKKYKIKIEPLLALAETCKDKSKKPLSKRILEV